MSDIQSCKQHVVLVGLVLFSSGLMMGFQYLIQNMGLAYYSFTTTVLTFGITGFVLSMNLLNFIISNVPIRAVLAAALLLEDAAMCLAFPAMRFEWLSYPSAILLGVGTSLLYSSCFYLDQHYHSIGSLITSAFGASTLLFYCTSINIYLLYAIIAFQWLFFAFFRLPPGLHYRMDRFSIRRPNLKTIMALSVAGSVGTQNMFVITYFERSDDQFIYMLGLLSGMASGIFLILLRPGVVFLVLLDSLFCILVVSFEDNIIIFYIAFFITCLSTGGILGGIISINTELELRSNNFYVYIAMLTGNAAGFLSSLGIAVQNAVYVAGAVLMLAGLAGLLEPKAAWQRLGSDADAAEQNISVDVE